MGTPGPRPEPFPSSAHEHWGSLPAGFCHQQQQQLLGLSMPAPLTWERKHRTTGSGGYESPTEDSQLDSKTEHTLPQEEPFPNSYAVMQS